MGWSDAYHPINPSSLGQVVGFNEKGQFFIDHPEIFISNQKNLFINSISYLCKFVRKLRQKNA